MTRLGGVYRRFRDVNSDLDLEDVEFVSSSTDQNQALKSTRKSSAYWRLNVHSMEVITEKDVPTWQRNEQTSVIDLTYVSHSLTNHSIRCGGGDNSQHSSDHFPIRTTLDSRIPIFATAFQRNWKANNADAL
jgi:endonuclease/exonuclease/phosphatase family metal-dependent hydrolase